MGKHFDNETLKEQRKSRENFLELKKMQSGEIDAGPKPSESAIVPKTFSQRIKNIWYHDKKLIIGILAAVITTAFLVVQCSMQPKYDLQVVFYTYTPVLEENTDKIETYFEKLCGDLNSDGKVKIHVINCSYENKVGGPQINNNKETRLQATVAAEANALLYITDNRSYEHFTSIFGDDFFEGDPVSFPGDFYEHCAVNDYITLPDNLTVSCRKITGTMIEKDKNSKKYFNASQSVIKQIEELNNNSLNQPSK